MPNSLLSTYRITGIMQGLQDARTVPQSLRWLSRTPVNAAADGEVMARFSGQVTIADIIQDDQRAVAYTPDSISYEATAIPNIKHGRALTQHELNALNGAMNGNTFDGGLYTNYENRIIDSLLTGVRQRWESLIIAMLIDGSDYNRLGIKLSGVSWGMPANLKVTPAIPWTTAATATPVSDVWALRQVGRVQHGIDFNRMTLSTQAFQAAIATTEFQDKAKPYIGTGLTFLNINALDLTGMQALASNVFGLAIELADERYWYQSNAGAFVSEAFQPPDKVILTSSMDDNNAGARDLANAVVTESLLSSIVDSPTIGGAFTGPAFGPVAFAAADPVMNPPQLTFWGVARSWPRRNLLQTSAVLDVGTFS